jgi:hypothetical protein
MENNSKTDTSLNTTPNTDAPLATYELRKPFEINGKRLTKLILDMDALSADEVISTQNEHIALSKANPAHSDAYLPFMYVSKMNKMIVGDLTPRLGGGDALKIGKIVESFFVDMV